MKNAPLITVKLELAKCAQKMQTAQAGPHVQTESAFLSKQPIAAQPGLIARQTSASRPNQTRCLTTIVLLAMILKQPVTLTDLSQGQQAIALTQPTPQSLPLTMLP